MRIEMTSWDTCIGLRDARHIKHIFLALNFRVLTGLQVFVRFRKHLHISRHSRRFKEKNYICIQFL